ncbi:MAG: hypothetical protein AB1505_25095 [Candidatus Latescibacterota bacterium]
MSPSAPASLRAAFYEHLHRRYPPHHFDNWCVWAGNHTILVDGIRYGPVLARAYVGPSRAATAQVRVELFVGAVDLRQARAGVVDARLWTDTGRRGHRDAAGVYHDDPGYYLPMQLVCDAGGVPVLAGNNLVFQSAQFALDTTGVFSYTVEFSAHDPPAGEPQEWVSLNDMADNRNGVVVVSPQWVADCPSLAEVCARKVGASLICGEFHSGKLRAVTATLEEIPADVVYLLPFFKPGFGDLYTGRDVRKGTLGSVYAVQDFYAIDPALVSPPEEAELAELVALGLISDEEARQAGLRSAEQLAAMKPQQAVQRLGREALLQLIGRAELRQLVRRAHALGKKVIFDLVLMQTSRDNPLVLEHPEWYVRDEHGVPRIHQIAWLVYSDVALFDLVFNKPLQDYLVGVAPYWIETCGLDGVRIDASQTVDRPFLKRIKNAIHAVDPEALVLGETLCALQEAVDVPVDMIYALLVDFHRDVEQAQPLVGFLEEMHGRFAPRTVALAYFENHDSPRATQVWYDKYARVLKLDARARQHWQEHGREPQLVMALLKNLQATLIDLSAGFHEGSNLACGMELGSWWGERLRTDFENETLLDGRVQCQEPNQLLSRSYRRLQQLRERWPELRRGRVYYLRNQFAGGDREDRVFAYARYTERGALLLLHSFDPACERPVTCRVDYLPWPVERAEVVFDTYRELRLARRASGLASGEGGMTFALPPLGSQVVRLHPGGATRKDNG